MEYVALNTHRKYVYIYIYVETIILYIINNSKNSTVKYTYHIYSIK